MRTPVKDRYYFIVEGKPVPFKRPMQNGRRRYNDARYSIWKDTVGFTALTATKGIKPLWEGPVSVEIVSFGADPRADADNILKGIMDALEGIFYANDVQVRWANVRLYAKGNSPQVQITVERLSQ